jgi:hypothetical protein
MKSRKNLWVALLLLLACAAVIASVGIGPRRESVSVLSARGPSYITALDSAVDAQPSAHLVTASFRASAFPISTPVVGEATSHNPIQASGFSILPDHSLLVNNVNVVEDPNLTWDSCVGGTKSGAWTFDTLMMAIRNGTRQQAEQMLMDMLADFGKDVTINGFTAKARTGGMDFFNNWPVDSDGAMCNDPFHPGQQRACLSLDGPVHLNAIVNRIDIGQQIGNTADRAGQLRFVFGVTTGNQQGGQCGASLFNIILEYSVPGSITAQTWAQDWQNLSTLCVTTTTGITQTCAQQIFDPALLALTNQVVLAGEGGSGASNGSALADVRTNEIALDAPWELRQFKLTPVSVAGSELAQTAVDQTPDLSFDGGLIGGQMFCNGSNQNPACNPNLLTIETYIQNNQSCISNGTCTVQQKDPALLGASALNPAVFWDSSPSMGSLFHQARVIFAASPQFFDSTIGGADPVGGTDGTCNGCHGAETLTQTSNDFQQIANRASNTGNDQASKLAAFLVGCAGGGSPPCQMNSLNTPGTEQVQDPVDSSAQNTFGDVERRVNCMNTILGTPQGQTVSCDGAGH